MYLKMFNFNSFDAKKGTSVEDGRRICVSLTKRSCLMLLSGTFASLMMKFLTPPRRLHLRMILQTMFVLQTFQQEILKVTTPFLSTHLDPALP
eukprot:UN27734